MSSPWVKLHASYWTDSRLFKLRRALGPGFDCIPVRVWSFSAAQDGTGDLSAYQSSEIAEAIGFTGNGDELMLALQVAGFLDDQNRIVGWRELFALCNARHASAQKAARARWDKPQPSETRQRRAEEKRQEDHALRDGMRDASKLDGTSSPQPSPTRPAEPDEPLAPTPDQQAAEIYAAYPRHEAKQPALRAILTALKRKPADHLLARTKAFAEAKRGEEIRFIPMPATWFNQARYDDDPSSWNPAGKRFTPPAAVVAGIPEPENWRARMSQHYSGATVLDDFRPWALLMRTTQEEIVDALGRAERKGAQQPASTPPVRNLLDPCAKLR